MAHSKLRNDVARRTSRPSPAAGASGQPTCRRHRDDAAASSVGALSVAAVVAVVGRTPGGESAEHDGDGNETAHPQMVPARPAGKGSPGVRASPYRSPMDPEIVAHYEEGAERDRLAGWSLERLRTEELLSRLLPPPPARVLDVGGGPGRYAAWLSCRGCSVTLLDPVPLHVDAGGEVVGVRRRARRRPATCRTRTGSSTLSLVMGPLYHLVDASDRVAALREARAGGATRRGGRGGGDLTARVAARRAVARVHARSAIPRDRRA